MKLLSANRQKLFFVGGLAILTVGMGAAGLVNGPSLLIMLAIAFGIVGLYLLFNFLFGRGPEDRKRMQHGRDTVASLGYLRGGPPSITDDYKLEKLRREAESNEKRP